MGRPLTITPLDYYQVEPCRRLNPVQEERLRIAIADTERAALLSPTVEPTGLRIIDAWITSRPPAGEGYLSEASVVRRPRYAVRNREAPKRSTLLSRLWSLLR